MPHAFGGALALAWCTERARGTIDIDVNVLVPDTRYDEVIDGLPPGVKATKRDLSLPVSYTHLTLPTSFLV